MQKTNKAHTLKSLYVLMGMAAQKGTIEKYNTELDITNISFHELALKSSSFASEDVMFLSALYGANVTLREQGEESDEMLSQIEGLMVFFEASSFYIAKTEDPPLAAMDETIQ